MNLLASTSELVMSIATWVSVAIAAISAVLAARQANAAVQSLHAQRNPYVVVFPRYSPESSNVTELVVQNAGAGCARDVRFELSPEIVSHWWGRAGSGGAISSPTSGPFVHGLSVLTPGQQVVVQWDLVASLGQSFAGKTGRVTVRAKNDLGVECKPVVSVISLEMMTWRFHNVRSVADSLGDIASSVRKLVPARAFPRRGGR